MSITSANPDDLEQFVNGAARARGPVEDRLASLRAQERAVVAASPDFNVTSGVLGSGAQVFGDMATNERYVETIRRELLEADRDPATGVATISSAAVAQALRQAGLATPPPPVQVEPGVLLGLPPTTGFVDDPICAANGNFVHVETDLEHPGWAAALDVVRVYNSLAAGRPGAFGRGWSSVLDLRLDTAPDGVVRVHLADGAVVPFSVDASGVLRAAGTRPLTLVQRDDEWHLLEGNVKVWRFDEAGTFLGGAAASARLEPVRDSTGRVIEIRELRSGRSVHFEWDGVRVVGASTSDGRSAHYVYDGDDLVRVDRPAGRVAYELVDGRLAAVHDADGVRLAANTYDEDGRVVTQTNEFGRTTTYTYSDAGTTLVADTNGGPRNAFSHDRKGNVTSIVDGEGYALRLTYDGEGRVLAVRDRMGAVTRFAYDAAGNLVSRTDPDGIASEWTWDDAARLLTERHRNGATTAYEYEAEHRRPSRVTTPLGGVLTVQLSSDDLPLAVTDADGVVTSFEWDDDGQLVAMVDGVGNRTTFAFDEAGNLQRVSDGSGVVIDLEPDEAGRVLSSLVGGEPCASYSYTPAGRPLRGSDAEGVSWSAGYGTHGRLTTFTDAEGSKVGFEWDLLGNLEAVVAPDGARYTHFYDRVGRLVADADPEGRESRLELDREGRVVAVVDPVGRTWRRELDALGRTMVTTAPDGATTRYRYHPTGEVAEVVDATGGRTTTEVDAEGRIVALSDAGGATFGFVWSAAGRLLERRFPSGRVEKFTYDEAGRLVGRSGYGRDVSYALDGRGRVVAATSPEGTARLEYNPAGELIEVMSANGVVRVERDRAGRIVRTEDGAGVASSFSFDRRGLLAAALGADGLSAQYARDIRGRVAATSSPTGEETSYGYDATGFLSTISDPAGTLQRVLDPTGRTTATTRGGTTVERRLDAAGRVASLVAGGSEVAAFSYDGVGRLLRATGATSAVDFTWDPAGRLLSTVGPGGEVTYTRDADGLLAQVREGDRTVDLERDPHGRVSAVEDPLAGRVERERQLPRARDGGGRITGGRNGSVYRYDDAGRLVEALDSRGLRWAFAYGDDGLLASEESPEGARRYERGLLGRVETIEHSGGLVERLTYDASGRRTRRTRSDGSERRFEWDATGWLIAVVDLHADGTTERLDISIDALGRPWRVGDATVAWDEGWTQKPLRVGDRRYLHLDGRTREIAAGAVWSDRPADPFGASTSNEPRAGFLGELEAWGLVWLGARVYDTATREFLSPDPLPSVPGRPAFASAYAYGFYDPVNLLDPSGARPVSQADFQAYLDKVEQGRFGQAWEAVKNDPWGTLAMVGVAAVGTALLFTPAAAIGAGILIGVAGQAIPGILAGNFSPTQAAIGGAVGAIPGGNTLRGAVAFGAVAGAGQEITTQAIRGNGMDWGNVATQTALGGATGGVTRGVQVRINGARPDVDLPAPPTTRFVVASNGTATDLTRPAFNDLYAQVDELDVATLPNEAVFYSGRGNDVLARQFAEDNMRTTIEMTPGGKWLDDQNLYGPSSPVTRAEADAIWAKASRRYAGEASGVAVGFVEGARPDRVWATVEWPTLQANPNITNVITGGH